MDLTRSGNIGRQRARRSNRAWAALAAMVAPVLALSACGGSNTSNNTASATGTSAASASAPQTSAPTETPVAAPTSAPAQTGEATPTATSGGTATNAVPVYWVRSTARSTFLYREFRAASGDPVEAALRLMMSGKPTDTDYTTHWRNPATLKVTRSGQDLTVDVSKDAVAKTGVTPQQAQRSVQQLVWTATGAAKTNGKVTILIDGKPGTAWGVKVGTPVGRESTARAPIWVDTPTQGSTVKSQGGKLRITGSANVFEGNVSIEIADATGKVVARTNATAAMGSYEPFDTSVALKPGRYTLTAFEEDMSDGESAEGPRAFPVTSTFTLQ